MTEIPQNKAVFSFAELALATSGRLTRLGAEGDGAIAKVTGVATDTRAALAGTAFVALRGERFDAHDFVTLARERGAQLAIVEHELDVACPQLVVSDSRAALGMLGAFHRKRWGGRVLAVAGSAGKTSTKNSIAALLSVIFPGRVHKTPGNLNNEIGVPLVLLGLEAMHRECVLEIGTNQTGEVPRLVGFAAPDVSVLTLIDLEHSEGLGDLDAIEREEGAVFDTALSAAIGNVDDERVLRQWSGARGKAIGYGFGEHADYRVLRYESRGKAGSFVRVARPIAGALDFRVPALGKPGVYSALAALAVAELESGRAVEQAEIEAALQEALALTVGRAALCEVNAGLWVIDDTYNANPASMRAAIETARDLAEQRGAALHLVLGEMRELGAFSEAEHRRLGEVAKAAAPRTFIAVAGDASHAAREGVGLFVSSSEAAITPLNAALTGNDVVLVKGSRGVRTERIVEALRQAKGIS